MRFLLSTLLLFVSVLTYAQEKDAALSKADSQDFYYEIPSFPDTYSSETVAARLVDGLGFRYYWASEGLRQEDLDYKPNPKGRTSGETLEHIYGLSRTIINAVNNVVNDREDRSGWTMNDFRNKTLSNLKAASEILKAASPGEIDKMKAKFQRGDQVSEYPFWNMINGPIADAIYHTGQIVTFRRTSGNPINPNISVFQGRIRS